MVLREMSVTVSAVHGTVRDVSYCICCTWYCVRCQLLYLWHYHHMVLCEMSVTVSAVHGTA